MQIIGGGLIGLASAYALMQRGAHVRIIEARSDIALETSFANAGMMHTSITQPWIGPADIFKIAGSLVGLPSAIKLKPSGLSNAIAAAPAFVAAMSSQKAYRLASRENFRLAQHSLRLTQQWRQAEHIDDDCAPGKGLLKIFSSKKQLRRASDEAASLGDLGHEWQSLEGEGVARIEPALAGRSASKYVGGQYFPVDYSADARKFAIGLAKALRVAGAEILLNCPVSIVRERSNLAIFARSGELKAGHTIIAAGPRTAPLVRPIKCLPILPVTGYSLTFDTVHVPHQFCPKIPVVDERLHAAITPFSERIRIAGLAEIDGTKRTDTKQAASRLWAMLESVYPQIAKRLDPNNGELWTGQRPMSATGMPIIEEIAPKFWVNCGHGHMGWTLAAGSAARLVDQLK